MQDVDVSFIIEGCKVSLPVVKATTNSGLGIGLGGHVEMRDSGPIGTLADDLVGLSPYAMKDLVERFRSRGWTSECDRRRLLRRAEGGKDLWARPS